MNAFITWRPGRHLVNGRERPRPQVKIFDHSVHDHNHENRFGERGPLNVTIYSLTLGPQSPMASPSGLMARSVSWD